MIKKEKCLKKLSDVQAFINRDLGRLVTEERKKEKVVWDSFQKTSCFAWQWSEREFYLMDGSFGSQRDRQVPSYIITSKPFIFFVKRGKKSPWKNSEMRDKANESCKNEKQY